MVLAQPRDAVAPVRVPELQRRRRELRRGVAVEVLAPLLERRRVVRQQLLVPEQGVERIPPDGEAALRAAHEVVAEPRRVLVERVAGALPRAGERGLGLRALGCERRQDRAYERGAGGRALASDDDVDRRDAVGV